MTDEGQDQPRDGGHRIMVIGPDGQPMGMAELPGGSADSESADAGSNGIGEPAKVMRIGTMIKQLLEEVRAAPLDDASRARLKEIHTRSIRELETGLSPDLRDELERLSLPFTDDQIPSDAELRIAQAQLVGWLEGVFHGLQTALVAQQMAARMQLEQMRRGLPPGRSADAEAGGLGRDPAAGSTCSPDRFARRSVAAR